MTQPPGDFRRDGIRPRTGDVVSGDLLLTVGTSDGSEARPCPDEWLPRPRRIQSRSAVQDHSATRSRTHGTGPGTGMLLLDREADLGRLLGLLGEGRSIRLTGQSGSGRSALLAAAAEAAGELAPDGVIRLAGRRRTAADLLQALYQATYHAPDYRPGRAELQALLAEVSAVVVIDDVELDSELDSEGSGEGLEDLLATAPHCAFLIAAADDAPPLPADSRLVDHPVTRLPRPACLELTARLAGRRLDAAEQAWAVDLWFESEGLPARFVQAAALLRQRDVAVDAMVAAQEDRGSVFGTVGEPPALEDPAVLEGELRRQVPLPSVAEAAAPAVRLAEGLSEPAKAVLRLAVAFGGECPTAPHLSALVDVDHGATALAELTDNGLAVPCGGHHRLAAGVQELLEPRWGPAPDGSLAADAAHHFSWWVGHTSVRTEQIAAEADVLLGAALAGRAAGRHEAVLQLARAAAPALALSLRWGAWERMLQLGLAAARDAGAAADEAWFHHELGVLAFCRHLPQTAIAELGAGITLRVTLGELRGRAAARRMLDLIRAEVRELSAADPIPGVVSRRPVIRSLAQSPWNLAATVPRWQTRRALVLGAAVLTLGVLGTAVAVSLSGSDQPSGGQVQQPQVDDGSLPANLLFGPSGAASPSVSPTAGTASPSASPSESATGTRQTTAPATPGATSDRPTEAPPQPQPPAPVPASSTSQPTSSPSSTSPSTQTSASSPSPSLPLSPTHS